MQKAIRPALALLAFIGLMFAHKAIGQTQDWPWLGVIITDISSGDVEGYNGGGAGSYITGVEYAGPASAAGLLRHDIIIAVDGRTTLNTRELTCLIQGRRPGDVVSVTVMRAGQQQSIPATLGSWPPSKDFPRPALGNCGKEPVSSLRGGQLAAAPPEFHQRMTAKAVSAGTPKTTARNGNSPTTEWPWVVPT